MSDAMKEQARAEQSLAVARWVHEHPGKYAVEIPRPHRYHLIYAERAGLIRYSGREGWTVTEEGLAALSQEETP